jgi:hypothetical protein
MHIDLTSLLPALGIFASFIAHIISDHIKSSRHASQIESIIGKITPYLPAAQAATEQIVADVAKTV